MKLSISWLQTWLDKTIENDKLADKLTMSGLEVESIDKVADDFSKVVVGRALEIEQHPNADKLRVCQIDVGEAEALTIVCGAKNIKQNMKVAVALVGARLANNFKISKSKLRGVVSYGMICSSSELGISEESEGIMELPSDAPIGQDLREYLSLDDSIIDLAITPNRGDCLSTLGIATEIQAISEVKAKLLEVSPCAAKIDASLNVNLDIPESCPRYAGRVIKNIDANTKTPLWLQQRLERSGTRSINVIVDIMNYVMFELGQPMHAFDLAKISGSITVRNSKKSESLELLDGQTVELSADTMIIADDKNPLAIAGVMGGLDSGVTLPTKDIFLESAFFNPKAVAASVRNYNIISESSYRFERGVDPKLQVKAIERATKLIVEIAGGEPGPVIDVKDESFLPSTATIDLRFARVKKLLGLEIDPDEITKILTKLGFTCKATKEGLKVDVPPRRSDISMEADLIEEIIRVYGYDNLPTKLCYSSLDIVNYEDKLDLKALKNIFCNLGYQEVITYSFIDKKLQQLFDPTNEPKALINPITSEMSVMRTNLWPGLVTTYLYNQNRQNSRVRIFELGKRFIQSKNELLQEDVVSGLISGPLHPLQWSVSDSAADFFDLKGDIEKFLGLTHSLLEFDFKEVSHPALHPGQAAEIFRNGTSIGIFGALHPELNQSLGIKDNLFLFEIETTSLMDISTQDYKEVSKFPEIKRDLAILVDQTVPSQAIQDTISRVGGKLVKEVTIFDIYQGEGIRKDQKSVALALTLQDYSRTLVDQEIADLIDNVLLELKNGFGAELRG